MFRGYCKPSSSSSSSFNRSSTPSSFFSLGARQASASSEQRYCHCSSSRSSRDAYAAQYMTVCVCLCVTWPIYILFVIQCKGTSRTCVANSRYICRAIAIPHRFRRDCKYSENSYVRVRMRVNYGVRLMCVCVVEPTNDWWKINTLCLCCVVCLYPCVFFIYYLCVCLILVKPFCIYSTRYAPTKMRFKNTNNLWDAREAQVRARVHSAGNRCCCHIS